MSEAKAPEANEVPKAPKDTKNGVTRPKAGTQTGRVWEISDAISEAEGRPALRKEVIDQFEKEGGNRSTGATQYGKWRKYNGLEGRGNEAPAEDAGAAEASANGEVVE